MTFTNDQIAKAIIETSNEVWEKCNDASQSFRWDGGDRGYQIYRDEDGQVVAVDYQEIDKTVMSGPVDILKAIEKDLASLDWTSEDDWTPKNYEELVYEMVNIG